MASIGFPEHCKTVNLPSGLTYDCVHFPKAADSSKPTILFLHGFPSSSYDWHHQIKHFSSLGYGVIAPDLLGYGGTSPPDTLEPYKFKNISADLISILEACGIKAPEKVHIVGHDFGAILMGTLLAYHPEIAQTASFLAVPYVPPGFKTDMEQWKSITEKELGFEWFGYRRFLMLDDSWKLMDAHKESFFTLMYGAEETWVKDFLPAGRLEAWLNDDRKAALQDWVTPEYKQTRDRVFAKEDAYRGPTDWYRARFREHLGLDEEAEELGSPPPRLPCPTLYVQSKGTKIMTKQWTEQTGKFADDYEFKEAKGGKGHWVQLEVPEEVNNILEGFFKKHE